MNRENISADVIVIGGGIIGCAIAYRLACERRSVCVIEARRPGCEASGAAAGMLAAQAEADGEDEFLKLCLRSRALHAQWAERLRSDIDMDVEHRVSGLLYAAFSEKEMAALQERYRWQQRVRLAVEALDGNQARALEPSLSPQVEFALLFPDDGRVNNVRLTSALHQAAMRRGVRFITGHTVRQIAAPARGVYTIITDEAVFTAPWVVNAAGAWAGTIRHDGSYTIPIRPLRGQMVAVQAPALRFQRVIYSSTGYMVPRPDGQILIGSTMEDAGYDKSVTAEGLRRILEAGMQMAPEIGAGVIAKTWAGLRPCTPDRMPVIGLGETPGLVVATGHCRNGILLAPITAEMVTELVVEGRPSVSLQPYSPARFQPNNT